MQTVRLSPAESAALDELVAEARALLGRHLREARLFGSRARGEGDEDSDLDVALIVTSEGRRMRNRVLDAAYDIGLRHGVLLAPLVIDEARLDELRARERLIARDLDTQGIVL